jgi:hypothetical protein
LGDLKHCSLTSKTVALLAVAVVQQSLGVLQLANAAKGGAPSLNEAAAKPPLFP